MIQIQNGHLRIKNSVRQSKKERQKLEWKRSMTPPKHAIKNNVYVKTSKYCQQFGYDYDSHEQCETMKYLKQDFETKISKRLGNKMNVKKLGRQDKYKLNQQLGGRVLKKNPLLKIMNRVQMKLRKSDLIQGFQALKF